MEVKRGIEEIKEVTRKHILLLPFLWNLQNQLECCIVTPTLALATDISNFLDITNILTLSVA